jgi:hypothetical protein
MKKILVVLAAMAMLLTGGVFAADTAIINGPNNDDVNTVEVFKTNDAGFNRYVNARFQYAVDVPVAVNQAYESTNGDGCTFIDTVDNANYVVYGANNTMKMSIRDLYNMDMGVVNFPTLTSKAFTKNSYAVSWEKDNVGFYKKVVLNKDTYTSFGVVYPLAKKAQYKKIIAHMDKSFVPTGVNVKAK